MEELLTRAVARIYPSREALASKLGKDEKLRIYWGVDPTGPDLHLGHAVPLMKLREFQDLGHQAVLLLGDFTAMIGDPTDKMTVRPQLSQEKVGENCKNYLDQVGKILDLDKTEVRYNSEWWSNLSSLELIKLASRLTYTQLIKRDMFQKRLSASRDLFLHELLYPLLQGYDSVVLDADLEIGGNDQTFNMLIGRDLMKGLKQKEKFVLATKLLAEPGKEKMGKTAGNMIRLSDSASEMYGRIMSWPDSLLAPGFELCTRLSQSETNIQIAVSARDGKMALAREVVKIYHGQEAAVRAEQEFVAAFRKKEPRVFEEIKAPVGSLLVDILLRHGLVGSKSEWRRFCRTGAVHDLERGVSLTDEFFKLDREIRLRLGKKRFVKILPN